MEGEKGGGGGQCVVQSLLREKIARGAEREQQYVCSRAADVTRYDKHLLREEEPEYLRPLRPVWTLMLAFLLLLLHHLRERNDLMGRLPNAARYLQPSTIVVVMRMLTCSLIGKEDLGLHPNRERDALPGCSL